MNVKEIENAFVANLALGNQAYEATNERFRGTGRRTVRAGFGRHKVWKRWYGNRSGSRWRENEIENNGGGKMKGELGGVTIRTLGFIFPSLARSLDRSEA